MATLDFGGVHHDERIGHRSWATLRAGWQSYARRRQERRGLAAIARLGPRLIADVGLDPQRIEGTVGGGWDRLDPVGLRMLMPSGARV